MKTLPTGVKRSNKSVRTALAGYLGGVSSFDLSRLLGHPKTGSADSIYTWRLEVKRSDLTSKPFYIDIYDYNVKDETPETPIENIYTWNIASDYVYGALYIVQELFPKALVTKDFWRAFDFGEKAMKGPTRVLNKLKVVAAPADTDKKRKLEQIRKKKAQLRQKKADFDQKVAQDLHTLRGEEIKVKYDNKPKPKPKTPKRTPKKAKKSYVGK